MFINFATVIFKTIVYIVLVVIVNKWFSLSLFQQFLVDFIMALFISKLEVILIIVKIFILYYKVYKFSKLNQVDLEINACEKMCKLYRKLGENNTERYADVLHRLAYIYEEEGKEEECLQLYQQNLEIRKNILGNEHPDLVFYLDYLAIFYESRWRYEEALPLYLQSLAINEKVLGINNIETAKSLGNLARLYWSIAKYKGNKDNYVQAELRYKQVLDIREKLLGSNHIDVADSLNTLSLFYKSRMKYEKALEFCEKALYIRKEKLGYNHIDTAYSLNNLATIYQAIGKNKRAINLFEQALKIFTELLGINHIDTATSLSNLAALYKSLGRYNEALPLYQQAKDIEENILGINHHETITSVANLASLYSSMGKYNEALPLYEQTFNIRRKVLKSDHPEISDSLHDLATLYYEMGEYDKALSIYKECLKNTNNSDYIKTAKTLNNLALLYQTIGRDEEALRIYKKVLNIKQSVLGINHIDTATCFQNLAHFYQEIRQYQKALPLFKKALKISKKSSGLNHPQTAIILNNLGFLYLATGKYTKALFVLKQALDINKKNLGINHPSTLSCLNDLGLLYQTLGDYEKALPIFEQALDISKNFLYSSSPYLASSLRNLAIILIQIGRYEKALDLLLEFLKIELNLISRIFKISSEKQRLIYIQKNYHDFAIFLSFISQYFSNSVKGVQSAFELIEKRKFIITETTILQKNAILSGRYPHLSILLKEYEEKTQKIIRLTFHTLTKEQNKYQNQLIEEQQEIEQELSRQITELNLEEKLLEIDRRAVALELPAGSTLLEFVKFRVFNFKAIPANGDTQWKPARYLAFILPAGQPDNIQIVDLGEADNIDRLIKVFRENIIQEKSDGDKRMITKNIPSEEELDKIKANPELNEVFQNKQQLKQLLFDPIQKCLPVDIKKLIIAPDGELNLLPFELLPLNDHQYLMDEYTISYLNVGRDLIRLKFPSTTQPTQPLIIANPDYNLTDENAITSADTAIQTQGSIDTVYYDLRKSQPDGMFTPIPGTGLESVQVSRYLGVTPQTEKNALESLVKLQTSPHILHIATHGYFLSLEDLLQHFKTQKKENIPFFESGSLYLTGLQNIENPLLRAGLAFAGANTALNGGRLPAAAEDGILTAQDVATFLDLSATELVVLSACESGLGEVKLGESVHGLRHAFLQAGAKSLIVSLWAVSDISTAILMGQFYHYYLEDKKPVGKALEQAKRYVCNLTVGEMRDTWLTDQKIEYVGRYSEGMENNLRILRNDADDYKPYRHPKYWGAFIYMGLAD